MLLGQRVSQLVVFIWFLDMVFGTVWCQAILFLSLSLWYVCSYGQCSMAVGWLPSRLAKDAGMYVCVFFGTQ